MRKEIRAILENEVGTTFETAIEIGVDPKTIWLDCEFGKVDSVKIGNVLFIDKEDIPFLKDLHKDAHKRQGYQKYYPRKKV